MGKRSLSSCLEQKQNDLNLYGVGLADEYIKELGSKEVCL